MLLLTKLLSPHQHFHIKLGLEYPIASFTQQPSQTINLTHQQQKPRNAVQFLKIADRHPPQEIQHADHDEPAVVVRRVMLRERGGEDGEVGPHCFPRSVSGGGRGWTGRQWHLLADLQKLLISNMLILLMSVGYKNQYFLRESSLRLRTNLSSSSWLRKSVFLSTNYFCGVFSIGEMVRLYRQLGVIGSILGAKRNLASSNCYTLCYILLV